MSLDLSVFDNLPKYDIVALKLKLAGVLFNDGSKFLCLNGDKGKTLFLDNLGNYLVFEPVTLNRKYFLVIYSNCVDYIKIDNNTLSLSEPLVIMTNNMTYFNEYPDEFLKFKKGEFCCKSNIKCDINENGKFKYMYGSSSIKIGGMYYDAYKIPIFGYTFSINCDINLCSPDYSFGDSDDLHLKSMISILKGKTIEVSLILDSKIKDIISIRRIDEVKSIICEESCRQFSLDEQFLHSIELEKSTRFNSLYYSQLKDKGLINNDFLLLRRTPTNLRNSFNSKGSNFSTVCVVSNDSFIQFRLLEDLNNYYFRIDLDSDIPVIKAKFFKRGGRKILYDSLRKLDFLVSKPIPKDKVEYICLSHFPHDVSSHVPVSWFCGEIPIGLNSRCLEFNKNKYGVFDYKSVSDLNEPEFVNLELRFKNDIELNWISFEILRSCSDYDKSFISNKKGICGLLISDNLRGLGLRGGFNN